MSDVLYDIPQTDSKPPISHELVCEKCGTELVYSGRGRKPKFCPEHRPGGLKLLQGGQGGNSGTPKTKGANASLAGQATDIILQWTDIMALVCMMTGLTATEAAIHERQGTLREQLYASLLTNPARCRSIINVGSRSSDFGFFMALGMFAAGVGSTAFVEIKEKVTSEEDD